MTKPGSDESISELLRRQTEIIEKISQKGASKDFWDKFSASSTFFSSVVVALVGLYFTNQYNQRNAERESRMKAQEIRISEVELLEKFFPYLNGSENDKKLALIAISSLGNTELASKFAVLDKGTGAEQAMASIAQSGSREERDIAERALRNFNRYSSLFSDIRGGSRQGREALDAAIAELKSGAWESGAPNSGPRIKKYFKQLGLDEGFPWSGIFIAWCFSQTHNGLPFRQSGSLRAIEADLKSKGWLHTPENHIPQPGDILFMPISKESMHASIIFKYENGIGYGIEGNSNDSTDRDGRMVIVRERKLLPHHTIGHIPD